MQHYASVGDLWQVGGFPRVLWFPPPNKTDHHDITEILLKVTLNTITLTLVIQQTNNLTNSVSFRICYLPCDICHGDQSSVKQCICLTAKEICPSLYQYFYFWHGTFCQNVIKFVSDLWQVGYSTNKTHCHDITEIVLNTITIHPS